LPSHAQIYLFGRSSPACLPVTTTAQNGGDVRVTDVHTESQTVTA
jgi:hypothetical protein